MSDPAEGAAALEGWTFSGDLRPSQQRLLATVEVAPPEPLHIVSPPGSGKTLLGLMLAMRRGSRTVVFTPTTTIQAQWVAQARELAPAEASVSTDVLAASDCTVLTYQRISVPAKGDAFEPIARSDWLRELEAGGRNAVDAEAWLTSLQENNRAAYQSGLRRRSSKVRRAIGAESPDQLATTLHPNAREAVDRLVAAGVTTVILDECHHLLDHWALVIAYLQAQIRATGGVPLLIGLTATLPSEQDASAYENYTALLGDVDYEQPTPAVVREAALAPYRDLVWFTAPTVEEQLFLSESERLLTATVTNTLGSPEGRAFLRAALVGSAAGPEPQSAEASWWSWATAAVGTAFTEDFALAEAAAGMLRVVDKDDPLLQVLPEGHLRIGDGEIRLLARFLLDHVLNDPQRTEQWQRAKRVLADFGYALTDSGIRRTRNPVDTVLSTSAAKDDAVADVLAMELEREGYGFCAVVVSDFAEHAHGSARVSVRGGALRCFARIVTDVRLPALVPVLVTGQHLRIATRHMSMLMPRLAALLGANPELVGTDAQGAVSDIRVSGASSASVLGAVSQLAMEGIVTVVVGTRGLLGEGWDCPAVDTLIDLTTASTATASQQLRGRTMRLNPGKPEKVAHNWTVVAVQPGAGELSADVDVQRLRRKLASIWGTHVGEASEIVLGIEHTLTPEQLGWVRDIEDGSASRSTISNLNDATMRAMLPRPRLREQWHVGTVSQQETTFRAVTPSRSSFRGFLVPDSAVNQARGTGLWSMLATAAMFVSGMWAIGNQLPVVGALALLGTTGLGFIALRALRRYRRANHLGVHPHALATVVGAAIVEGLQAAEVLPASASVEMDVRSEETAVWVQGCDSSAQRAFREALVELTSAVRTPRFLIELSMLRRGTPTLLPVPSAIGKRRAAAHAFADVWKREGFHVGLHEMRGADDLELLVRARRSERPFAAQAFRRDVWS